MKLMLTSNGLSSPKLRKEFVKLLPKAPLEARVIVLHSAQKPSHLQFVHNVGKELEKAGLLFPNIRYANFSCEKVESLEGYDVSYICGGNTYSILDQIKQKKLDRLLKAFVNRRGIYLGISAGSIIAGENIEIAGWGSEGDPNEIGLKDLTGLGLTNIAIFPHYKNKLRREVEEFREKVSYPVEILRDGEAWIISGRKTMRISRGY